MKRLFSWSILCLALLACTRITEKETDLVQSRELIITAYEADSDVDTKTARQSDNVSVYWSPADAISVFYDTGNNGGSKFVAQNTEEAPIAQFKGTLDVVNGGGDYWGVYPYSADNSCDGSSIVTVIPSTQVGKAGTFADNTFVTMARSKDLNLEFYNICCGIKFSLTRDDVKDVTIRGNKGEDIAGKVKVEWDANGKPAISEYISSAKEVTVTAPGGGSFASGTNYYLVLAPQLFSSGFTLTLTTNDSKKGSYVYEDSRQFNRSKFIVIPDLDSMVSSWTDAELVPPDNEIWYTSTNGEVVIPNNSDSFNTTLLSNTYEEGKGILRFAENVNTIGSSAFNNCQALQTIQLPTTTETIGNMAFRQCYQLKGITLPEGLTTINADAFSSCSNLSSITLPNSLVTIGSSAFLNCSSLTSIHIPDNVSSFFSIFGGCTSLVSFSGKYASEDGRCLIRNNMMLAFAPAGLSTYTVPATVTSIYNDVFRSCNELEEVILPEGLKELYSSFFYCRNLTKLVIPSTVNKMTMRVVDSSPSITQIVVKATVPPTCLSDNLFPETNNCPIYVPASSVDAYKAAEHWSAIAHRIQPIPEAVSATKYLTFTSEGSTTLSLSNNGGNAPMLYYSIDKTHWTQWDYSSLTFTSASPLYLCGDNPEGFSFSTGKSGKYSKFTASGDSFGVSGSIMSLLNKDEDISVIPASSLFYRLFQSCTGLTSAPELPATTLTNKCYFSMFSGCTGLTKAPALPATTLAKDCYAGMFLECTGLETAPQLPAASLEEYCYGAMFQGCTSLTVVPGLPATTLADQCYSEMFSGCTGLTEAPELPATELARQCYEYMFSGCTGLTKAPALPAPTLASHCYTQMFQACSALHSVKCLATDINADSCVRNWLQGVANSGTFVKAAGMNDWPSGASGIPAGWTVENEGGGSSFSASKYLTITSEGSTTLSLSNKGGNAPMLYYSTDKINWTLWDYSGLTFTDTAPLYLCGDNEQGICSSASMYSSITASGSAFSVSGDIMSLLDKDKDLLTIPCSYCFFRLFAECGLLASAPALPATTLSEWCYDQMFVRCKLMETAPELPAMTLANGCYYGMFVGCTKLKAAPDLIAPVLVSNCYREMFYGCSSLKYIRCLATDISAGSCLTEWLYGVPSSGTFVRAVDMNEWTPGKNGIPSGWIILKDGETGIGDENTGGNEDITFEEW